MRKTFILEDLECAHCGSKMEQKIKEMDGVKDVSVTFMTQKLVIDAEEDKFDEIVKKAKKAVKKIERDVEIRPL